MPFLGNTRNVVVGDNEISDAITLLLERSKLLVEGAGAVGVAALRAGVVRPDAAGTETVLLLTGRNVAPKLLSEVLHT